jgi:hypothetical protein
MGSICGGKEAIRVVAEASPGVREVIITQRSFS